MKNGCLIPDRKKKITFGEYAAGFWERGSEYIKRQESRKDITDGYIVRCRQITTSQIKPFFGNILLGKITEKKVNDWLLGFKSRKVIKDGKEVIKHYHNTTANTALGTFNVMMSEAVRQGLIPANPGKNVLRLKDDRRNLEILTITETQKLFPHDYRTVWGDKEIVFIANRLASLTGMRIGEILGLRGEYVFDDHILVCGQWGTFKYVPHTKTRLDRKIPLMPEMLDLLRSLMDKNGNGFIFSQDGGVTAVARDYIARGFFAALRAIGIDDTERKRRGLTLHGWRHFLNTVLLQQGLTIEQVQSVTGHLSKRTTRMYTHIDARQINDVIKVQQAIIGNKEKTTVAEEPTLTLVKSKNEENQG
jgi:integrase